MVVKEVDKIYSKNKKLSDGASFEELTRKHHKHDQIRLIGKYKVKRHSETGKRWVN